MSRCIYVDELIEFFDGYPDYVEFDIEDIKSIINEQDAADVVEVVRCKDCKYWNNETDLTFCEKKSWLGTDATDYCSFGERAEE